MSKIWRPNDKTEIDVQFQIKLSNDVPKEVVLIITSLVTKGIQLTTKKIMDQAKKKGIPYRKNK